MAIYGYARVSTQHQNIERQIRNIKSVDQEAVIVKEIYTGTKIQGRKEFDRLIRIVKSGDTIIFDSVSRMSRNADEGFKLYQELYEKGVELVFCKEQYINTKTYKEALKSQIGLTGGMVDAILKGINEYLLELAKEQIKLAFEQSQKEVDDLHQRTREGIETARLDGKQIGQVRGRKLTTKKSIEAKKIILKHNKKFGGALTNKQTCQLAKITKTTFYKYVKELIEEQGSIL